MKGTGNNFASGYLSDGLEKIDEIIDVINKEVEKCDCMQGIQLINTLGGGTGSGLGALIMCKMNEEHNEKINCSFSVSPSQSVSDNVLEPYNALLSLNTLMDCAAMIFAFDNEALYNICFRTLKMPCPSYSDINNLMALIMSS